MKKISKTFLTGLFTILPLLATIYVLYWLSTTAESILGRGIRVVLPAPYYWPGMGVAAGFLIVFFIGLLMHAWIVQKIIEFGEKFLFRIPLIKSVYGAFRDFFDFVSGAGKTADSRQVVMVKIGDTGIEMMGFVTRHNFSDLPEGIGSEDMIAVYIPVSYQIGGYTVMVPKSIVRPVDISMEQALRFALTAGMMTKPPYTAKKKKSRDMIPVSK
jgi:uncharacterized membrane protein